MNERTENTFILISNKFDDWSQRSQTLTTRMAKERDHTNNIAN